MLKKLTSLLFLSLFFQLPACSQQTLTPPGHDVDVTEASSNQHRFQKPDGIVNPGSLKSSVNISLTNSYPIWRDNIDVILNISIKNISNSHLPARVMGHLFIYSFDEKKPLYWSNIDIAYSEPAAPGLISILSIPANSSKEITIPISQTTWTLTNSAIWPDEKLYSIVPTDKYLMRFELDFYSDDDQIIETAVSNFIQFSTIQTAPEVIIPDKSTP